MAKLEDVLPALREGKKIRAKFWRPECYVVLSEGRFRDELGYSFEIGSFCQLNADWEIVPEPNRVADYLVPIFEEKPLLLWRKATHPIGSQPEGAVMVPGSEKILDE